VPNLYTYTVDNPIMYTDPSGAIIVLGDDSPEDNARIQNALDLLKRWTNARSRILELEKSPCRVEIIIPHRSGSSSRPCGDAGKATVEWDPNDPNHESELKLAHELYHVCLGIQGREPRDTYFSPRIPNHPMPSAEFVDYENRVEKQLRERRHRSNHYHEFPKLPKASK
jgi:hypothetical protein